MPTTVYNSENIVLVDGTEIYITPLKIKYLRQFMESFELVKALGNTDEAFDQLLECVRIAMKQYFPAIKTVNDVADNLDMATMYRLIDIAGGISNKKPDEDQKQEKTGDGDSSSGWRNLDLAKLEAEVFLLGIWKDYEELESCLSMPELTATLEIKREIDYQDKKFNAAMQGVDLDKQSGKSEQNKWEEMKARVFSGGKTTDGNDILAFQGANAAKAGFGIGLGLAYEDLSEK
jgi:hypothetical protein